MEEKVPPPAPTLPRGPFYTLLAVLIGAFAALVKPVADRFVTAETDWLYGPAHRPLLIVIALLVPFAALAADVGARGLSRWFGARSNPRPFALGAEALLIAQSALFALAGFSVQATFGPFPRLLIQGSLLFVVVALALVAGQLGWMGRLVAAAPFFALAIAYPSVLPGPIGAVGVFAGMLAIGLVRAPAPEDEPSTPARAKAAFALLAAVFAGGAFIMVEYGLALGMNVVPAIASWNAGLFGRMERGCLATHKVLPYDPVWRVFLSDIRAQQGRWDEARALAREVLDSGAGGACGALAEGLLKYLDRFDAMRAKVAAQKLPPATTGCAGVNATLAMATAILEFGAAKPGAVAGTPESLAYQVLPMLREAVKAEPDCARAHQLLVRALDGALPRIKKYQLNRKIAGPDPGDPHWPDLEAERARSAAAAEKLEKASRLLKKSPASSGCERR